MSAFASAALAGDTAPALNPLLNRAELAEAFQRSGRIHIPQILTDASARRMASALEHETPWRVICNEGSEHLEYDRISAGEQQKLAYAAWNRARTGFQFFYHRHRLSARGEPYSDPAHYLARVVEFLASPSFMTFMRDVTGMDAIAWVNMQATLYKPLDFLTVHDDDVAGDNRLVAYVLNLTPNWRPDWGGALQFFDDHGHIEQGYMPSFNALNLFRVPKQHSVAQVAPFGGNRYSITGWYHSNEPV